MKKHLALLAFCGLFAATTAHAQVDIYITGSTAFRANAYNSIRQVFVKNGSLASQNPGDPASSANQVTWSGTITNLFGNQTVKTFPIMVACESLSGIAAVQCRCDAGLTDLACDSATLPAAASRQFANACGSVDVVESATGERAKKAAGRAAKAFKKALRAVAGRAGRDLPPECRSALATILDVARANAAALKAAR